MFSSVTNFSVASGLIFTEVSRWVTNRSGLPSEGKEVWNKSELCSLIVVSMFLHIVLIGFGYGSNRQGNRWVFCLTWVAYYLGDWVATVSLTTLLKRQAEKINAIEMLWAPFLLLHLGNAETVAAPYLEESTLWFRYLVGLLIQFGMAFYIYLRFQTKHPGFNFLAMLIFVAGMIKCGERIWILGFSSFERHKKSVLRAPPQEIGHTYEGKFDLPKHETLVVYLKKKCMSREAELLHQAYLSFKMFVPLFSGLKLRIYKKLENIFNLEISSAKEAFMLVDIELEFLYDMLYTRTIIFNPLTGLILLFITLLSCLSGLIAFSIIISKHAYPHVDIAITYLLLVGAIVGDTVALITQLFSNWTLCRLTKPNERKLPKCVGRAVNYWLDNRKLKKGITSMQQNSLLKYCLKSKVTKISAAAKKLRLENTFLERFVLRLDQKLQRSSWMDVDLELKDFIYCNLKKKRKQYEEPKEQKFDFKILSCLLNKGAYEFLKTIKLDDKTTLEDLVGWTLKDLEFTNSLLLWHIATDILYYDRRRRYPRGGFSTNCRISKYLSDYMMYLLVKAPFMLRKGIGELRYKNTCREALKFFHKEMGIKGVRLAAMSLLAIDAEARVFLYQMKGQGKSVFFGGSALASGLQWLTQDEKFRMDEDEVWEIISRVWMEMLISAANHCDWKDHIKQLRNGKELLTHVALLMAHLGLSKHIRMADLPPQPVEDNYNPPWNWDELNRLAYYLA